MTQATHRWLKWPINFGLRKRKFCIYCGMVVTTIEPGKDNPTSWPVYEYSRGGEDLGRLKHTPHCPREFVPVMIDGWQANFTAPPPEFKPVRKSISRGTTMHIYETPHPAPKCELCGGWCGHGGCLTIRGAVRDS